MIGGELQSLDLDATQLDKFEKFYRLVIEQFDGDNRAARVRG